MTVLFSDGVVVTCMAAKYTGGLRGAPHGGLVGETGRNTNRAVASIRRSLVVARRSRSV
jgi:hypothetical protein